MALTMEIEVAYQRGFELRCEGRYAESRRELEKVLSVDPTHCDALWQLGLIQGFEGDFESSQTTLSDLVERFPNNQGVRYDLAMTQMMLGMQDEACANFREVLKQNPNHEKAQQQAVYCD